MLYMYINSTWGGDSGPARSCRGSCLAIPRQGSIGPPSRHDCTTLTAWGQPHRGSTPAQPTDSTHTAVSRFPRRLTAVRPVAVGNRSRALMQYRCDRWARYGINWETQDSTTQPYTRSKQMGPLRLFRPDLSPVVITSWSRGVRTVRSRHTCIASKRASDRPQPRAVLRSVALESD
jgi:hypothetical protein